MTTWTVFPPPLIWILDVLCAYTYCTLYSKFTKPVFWKLLWSPGINSKEWIRPVYVAWRAGTITLFLLGSYSRLFKNSSSVYVQPIPILCCLFPLLSLKLLHPYPRASSCRQSLQLPHCREKKDSEKEKEGRHLWLRQLLVVFVLTNLRSGWLTVVYAHSIIHTHYRFDNSTQHPPPPSSISWYIHRVK